MYLWYDLTYRVLEFFDEAFDSRGLAWLLRLGRRRFRRDCLVGMSYLVEWGMLLSHLSLGMYLVVGCLVKWLGLVDGSKAMKWMVGCWTVQVGAW
jgi:hypothetical protein